jgi:predicted MFS family arabinose efflux permease
MSCIATRISPFQALITTYVSSKRRGSFLSLLVAIGQVGYGLGGTISGPAYVLGGFLSNTILAAIFVAITAILVKYYLTEPATQQEHVA